MASRARDEERRGGRTGEGEGEGARGRFAGEGRENASDKIHLFPSFFFPLPRGIGVETHETSCRYRLISSKIRGKFSASLGRALVIVARHCIYTYTNTSFDIANGRESEKPVARETEVRIYTLAGAKNEGTKTREEGKKEESKIRVRNRQRPVFDSASCLSTGKNVLDRRRISVETRGGEGDRHLCEYRYNVVEVQRRSKQTIRRFVSDVAEQAQFSFVLLLSLLVRASSAIKRASELKVR